MTDSDAIAAVAELRDAMRALVQTNRELTEGLKMQSMAIQALAESIAEPGEAEEPEPELCMDGSPV